MTPLSTTLRHVAIAVMTAGSLAFGARAALARPALVQTCTDSTAQGSCSSTSDCRKICNRLSNGLIPVCDTRTHCCTCQKL